jgi:hypothetical protein
MAERLLNLIEPRGLDRRVLLAGWIAGAVAGMVLATCALLVLTGARIGTYARSRVMQGWAQGSPRAPSRGQRGPGMAPVRVPVRRAVGIGA